MTDNSTQYKFVVIDSWLMQISIDNDLFMVFLNTYLFQQSLM
jgi:hypothetical protein